jgi:hypothetical protein
MKQIIHLFIFFKSVLSSSSFIQDYFDFFLNLLNFKKQNLLHALNFFYFLE